MSNNFKQRKINLFPNPCKDGEYNSKAKSSFRKCSHKTWRGNSSPLGFFIYMWASQKWLRNELGSMRRGLKVKSTMSVHVRALSFKMWKTEARLKGMLPITGCPTHLLTFPTSSHHNEMENIEYPSRSSHSSYYNLTGWLLYVHTHFLCGIVFSKFTLPSVHGWSSWPEHMNCTIILYLKTEREKPRTETVGDLPEVTELVVEEPGFGSRSSLFKISYGFFSLSLLSFSWN